MLRRRAQDLDAEYKQLQLNHQENQNRVLLLEKEVQVRYSRTRVPYTTHGAPNPKHPVPPHHRNISFYLHSGLSSCRGSAFRVCCVEPVTRCRLQVFCRTPLCVSVGQSMGQPSACFVLWDETGIPEETYKGTGRTCKLHTMLTTKPRQHLSIYFFYYLTDYIRLLFKSLQRVNTPV